MNVKSAETTVYSIMDNSGETLAYSRSVLLNSEYRIPIAGRYGFYKVQSMADEGDDPEVVLVSAGTKMEIDSEGVAHDINYAVQRKFAQVSYLIYLLEMELYRKALENENNKSIIRKS